MIYLAIFHLELTEPECSWKMSIADEAQLTREFEQATS